MIHRATIVAKYWICHLKVVVAAGVYGFILVVTLIFIFGRWLDATEHTT